MNKREDLIFDNLVDSTKNIKIKINGIESFNEEELFDKMECNEYIMSIKTPTRYKKYEYYSNLNFKRKTNRGRKKKIIEEVKEKRGFGTCIQFEIILFDKKQVDKTARYYSKCIVIDNISYYPEEWKIKLFRNGTITIAGVKEDKYVNFNKTIKYFLNVIKKYIDFEDVDIDNQVAKLNNYKTALTNYFIDIYRMEKYFIKYFKNISYVSIKNLINAIKTPSVIGTEDFKWKNIDNVSDNFIINSEDMFIRSLNIDDKKVVKISKEEFLLKLKTLEIDIIYKTIIDYINILRDYVFITDENNFDKCIVNIIYYMLEEEINILVSNLLISKDISISRFIYVSNKFSALSIYFIIYDNDIKNEPVAKIFPSGKINIDGCNNPKNVPRIFDWVKKLLRENSELVWNDATWGYDCYLDTEFSMSESL